MTTKSSHFGPSEPAALPAAVPSTPTGPSAPASAAELAVWQKVRAGLVEGAPGYAGRPEYSPNDPALLDPLIQAVLTAQHGGVMPGDESQLRNVILAARARYIGYLQSPAGLALTERLVRQRYDSPVVTQSGGPVTLDFGLLPGRLQLARGRILFADSELREGAEWRSTEVGRKLQAALAQFPQAPVITLTVEIPSGTSSNRYQYSYDRGTDRVTVQAGADRPYVSAPLGHDVGPIVRGERSLLTSQLPAR